MKSEIEVGHVFPGGTYLGRLPPKGKCRDPDAAVDCHCGTYYECRSSVLKSGERKGCRPCRDRKRNASENAKVAALPRKKKLKIFDLAQEHHRAGAAALCEYDMDLVGRVWWSECLRLASLPASTRAAVYVGARRSVEAASKMFGLTRWEVLRIHFVHARQLREADARYVQEMSVEGRFQIALDLGVIVDPSSKEGRDLFEFMGSSIGSALNSLRGSGRSEFPPALLGSKDARFSWLYEVLEHRTEDTIFRCFGMDGVRFSRACRDTLIMRKYRSEGFLRERDACCPGDAASSPKRRCRRPIGDGRRLRKPRHATEIITETVGFAAPWHAKGSGSRSPGWMRLLAIAVRRH